LFIVLRQIASWKGDRFVVTLSAIGQPTWPTQPSVPPGSVTEQHVIVGYEDKRQKAWWEVWPTAHVNECS